jgi:hypothetical protein
MSFACMIRSNAAPATEGYGNTRDSIAITGDRIDDNEICEGDFVKYLKETLKNTRTEQDFERAGRLVGEFWAKYMTCFASGTPNYYAAINRLYSILSRATTGPIDKWLGFYAAMQRAAGIKKAA